MKKRKISIIVVSIVILTMGISGCSKEKTVIVDTNVQNSKSEGANISEETINLKLGDGLVYSPRYFDREKIYGTFGPSGGTAVESGTEEFPIVGFFKKNLYTLEKDNSIKETDIEPAFYSWGIETAEGIARDELPIMLGTEKENDKVNYVYYYNDKTGEKRKLGNADSWENEKYEGSFLGETKIIEGKSEFAYTLLNERELKRESGEINSESKLIMGNKKLNIKKIDLNRLSNIQIFGVNNNEKYECKGNGISTIVDIVYSKITEKFYAIDIVGKLYQVELKNNEAEFIEVDNIDIRWLDRMNEDAISVNEDGEILIFNKWDYGQVLTIIYNPKTKKTTYINKGDSEEIKVLKYFTEGNKVILGKKTSDKNEDIYIGELKDDYIKIYTKLDIPKDEEEYSGFRSAIMSDDGKKMLVGNFIFKPQDGYVANERFVYKILTFN